MDDSAENMRTENSYDEEIEYFGILGEDPILSRHRQYGLWSAPIELPSQGDEHAMPSIYQENQTFLMTLSKKPMDSAQSSKKSAK